MNIRLLEPAQTELDEAMAWYADQAPGLGDAFLLETLKTLRLNPHQPTQPSSNLQPGLPLLIGTSTGGRSSPTA